MRTARNDFLGQAASIAASAARLERLEDVRAPRLFVEHERDVLRKRLRALLDELDHADDVTWRVSRLTIEC